MSSADHGGRAPAHRWLRSERSKRLETQRDFGLGGCCSLWSPCVPLRRCLAHGRFTRPLWLRPRGCSIRCPHFELPLDSNICSLENISMAALLDLHPDAAHPVLPVSRSARGAGPDARRRRAASSEHAPVVAELDRAIRRIEASSSRWSPLPTRPGREGRRVHRHRRLAREDHHRLACGRSPPGCAGQRAGFRARRHRGSPGRRAGLARTMPR